MRVNIWIPDKLIPQIDEKAKKLGMARSQYLVYAAIQNKEISRPLPIKKERVPQNHVPDNHIPEAIPDSMVEDLIPNKVKKVLLDSVFSDEKKEGYHFNSTLGRYVKD